VVVIIRHLDLLNISAAVMLTLFLFHPVRVLSDWGLNSTLYSGVTAIGCLLLISVVLRFRLKLFATVLLVACVLLSGYEASLSASEVGTCYVEDNRYTAYFYCTSSLRGYQQIESLPVAMQDWCYWCFWR
jgi:hypothetical protein